MARAALKYVFAALLTLLSAQAVVPCPRVIAAIEIVWGTEAEQQPAQETTSAPPVIQARRSALPYASRTRPEPDSAVLFQRPPPAGSLFL